SGANLTLGATTLSGNATLDQPAGTSLTLGAIGDGGSNRSLTKTGIGTLTLNAGGIYGGGTTISAGTLRVTNPTGSATGAGPVSLAASTTLSGYGANWDPA